MCGICGIVDFGTASVPGDVIRLMTDSIRHRGPDDEGVFTASNVGLGHRRLSIIDLSETGHQPMCSADGRWTLVYNGELYNFESLRDRLEGMGHRFRGTSDSEVLLEAFAQWGVDALQMFDGMFGFALWDSRENELHLARDRFGIKPLYYRRTADGVAFGSGIKAILAADRTQREVDPQALHEYMYFGNALGTKTLFRGIAKLAPGHRLAVSRDGCKSHPYWSVSDTEQLDVGEEEAVAEVRTRLDETVRQHLVSDVPVGIFLSGGIDSSAITALASRHYSGALKTFSVGFDFDKGVNELDKARIVADRFGTDHREIHVRADNVPKVLEQLVRCHDEPFADAANIPLYLLCEQLEGEVKVILQGDGGDEIFAGYRRYNVLSADDWWRALAKLAVPFDPLIPRNIFLDRAMRFLRVMAHSDPAVRAALYMTPETLANPPTRTLSADWRDALQVLDPFARYREVHRGIAQLDPVQRMLYTDTQVHLPDTFLEKVDKSTMAHSIEVRVPFLGAGLTSYAMGLSSALKVRRGKKKFILRRALRGIVPDEILDGPKTGFSVPYGYWMREPLVEYLRSVVLDPSAQRSGLFDLAEVERAIAEHVDGRRNWEHLLYKLLNLALWQREYLC